MKIKDLERFYRWQALVYDISRSLFLFWYERAVSYLNIKQHDSVLDVACGTWKWIKYLKRRTRYVTWIDYSPSLLAVAKKKYPDWLFIQWDVSTYVYDHKFNKAICAYSLSMIDEREKTIQHTRNILTDNGIFVILDFWSNIHEANLLQRMIAWIISLCSVRHDKDLVWECKKYFHHVKVHQWLWWYYTIIVCHK